MKLKKNYLTSDEVNEIVNELVKHESATEREIIRIAMIYQFVVEDAEHFETANEYYDLYCSQNDIDFDLDLTNGYTVKNLLMEELSVDKAIKDFLKDLGKKVNTFNIEDVINQLETTKGMLSSATN